VQKNIHHFGGDGDSITLAGESAGAWSVLAHLRSNNSVCQRAFIMSAPSLAPRDAASAQRDFEHLVATTGIDKQAPDSEKLACLRNMTASALVALAPKFLVFPSWDPEWFSHKDESSPLEKAGEFSSRLDGIVIGCTAQEFAMFGIVSGWTKWSIDIIHKAIPQSIPDDSFADEVMRAYGINSILQDVALEGLIRFASEGLFANVISSATAYTTPPLSIYSFDQVDTSKSSPFYGYAYHSLDNVFTCRLPAVAGDQAPPEWRATADEHSRFLIDFIYGLQPWEVYSSSKRIQSFNGKNSGLVEWTGSQQWISLASTSEREIMLRIGGMVLMSLKA
jgi:carboxylesterase type B